VVILMILLASCLLPHTYSPTESFGQFLLGHATGYRAMAACALVGGLVLYSWISMIEGIAVPLSGRARLSEAVMFTGCVGFAAAMGVGFWVSQHPQFMPKVLAGARVAMSALAVAKIVVAFLVLRGLLRSRIAPASRLIAWSFAWLMFVLAAFAAALYFVPAARRSPSGVALALALAIPYNRLLGMPLAWHHNRHR
jgi:hypothetical protein